MLTRLSLNSKRSDNPAHHSNFQFNQKQNNQKNLNRSKNIPKLSQLEQCLLIKQVDSKNYLTNADTKVNIQSNCNSIQPPVENKSRHILKSSINPLFFSPIQREKHISDTQQYCELYGKDILVYHELNTHFKTDFLQQHEINPTLRARMLDWMVQVMESYKFTQKTYFASVELMDRYLSEVEQSVPLSQLHILGVISMYVATKMEEVYPLKLKTVYEKIVHRKISKESLTQMQMKLFAVLGHKTNSWTFYDLALLKIYDRVVIEDQTEKQRLENVISYVSKCIVYDYQLYKKYDMETLARVVANICAKILVLNYETQISIECDIDVVNTYKGFKQNFKGLNNILKFSEQSIVNLVESYFNSKMY